MIKQYIKYLFEKWFCKHEWSMIDAGAVGSDYYKWYECKRCLSSKTVKFSNMGAKVGH